MLITRPSACVTLCIMREDKVIFKQFTMSTMAWKGIDGKAPMRPKDDGMGLMGSGVNMRDLGYGKVLLAKELKIVNSFSKHIVHNVQMTMQQQIYGALA